MSSGDIITGSSSDTVNNISSSNNTSTTFTSPGGGTKRKLEGDGVAAVSVSPSTPSSAAAEQPADKKFRVTNGSTTNTVATTIAAPAASTAASAAAGSTTPSRPATSSAPSGSPGAVTAGPRPIPKKVLPTPTAVGKPVALPKPVSAVSSAGKPVVAAGGTAVKPAVTVAKPPSSSPASSSKSAAAPVGGGKPSTGSSVTTAAKPAVSTSSSSSKPASAAKRKDSDSDSSSSSGSDSSSDGSSDSDDDDEELLVKPKATAPAAAAKSATPAVPKNNGTAAAAAPAAAAATPVKKASTPATTPAASKTPAATGEKKTPATASAKKRKAESSDSSSSDDSSSDSDSSEDSSSDSDSSDDSSEDSDDSSDSDASVVKRKKKPAKKKAAVQRAGAAKGGGKIRAKYDVADSDDEPAVKAKRPKGEGEESGSSSEDEGVDESKVILFPMDKYTVRSDIKPLKETMGANKWWNRMRPAGDKTKWVTLEHNGCLFPAPYTPHGIPVYYDGQEVKLTQDQEEVATMWAAMIESDHCKNPTFAKNFFRCWKVYLGVDSVIKELDKCDFTRIANHVRTQKENEKLFKKVDKIARARDAKERLLMQDTYGYALVDGFKEKVGNFRVEPPALFRGRGNHPKTGTLKQRVKPEDMIINIGHNVEIPAPPAGHKWKGIIHNNKVTWLAFYKDNVNGDFKYIWLAPSSRFKGESDIKKYTKAQKLMRYISEIRRNYMKEMRSPHSQFRQRATAIYLIDFLALRVGNEKDSSEQADTVGCCSLRVEHLEFTEPNTVAFDFLGKDSMRYHNSVALDQQAYDNLRSFCKNKKPKEEVFDTLTTTLLNEHLKTIMPELTAKVFRTYNASVTLEKELRQSQHEISVSDTNHAKVAFYNRANREVAILCNHQRSVPKGHEAAVAKLKDQLEVYQDEREELVDCIAAFKKKVVDKAAAKEREKAREQRHQLRLAKARAEAKAKLLKEKDDRARLRAAGKFDGPDSDDDEKKEGGKKKVKQEEEDYGVKDKSKPKPAELTKAEAALEKLDERIVAHEAKIALRDDNKEVALGTSKINYMDPRITVSWCKALEVPLELVFNKSLVTKFPWAMEVPPDWSFKPTDAESTPQPAHTTAAVAATSSFSTASSANTAR